MERDGLLDTLDELGVGSIDFTPLAQGILTSKYLHNVPEGSWATQGKSLLDGMIHEQSLASVRALNEMAQARGQTLAQMALAWVLRNGRVTTALISASRPEQTTDCAGVVRNLDFTAAELKKIDEISAEEDINLWARSSDTA